MNKLFFLSLIFISVSLGQSYGQEPDSLYEYKWYYKGEKEKAIARTRLMNLTLEGERAEAIKLLDSIKSLNYIEKYFVISLEECFIFESALERPDSAISWFMHEGYKAEWDYYYSGSDFLTFENNFQKLLLKSLTAKTSPKNPVDSSFYEFMKRYFYQEYVMYFDKNKSVNKRHKYLSTGDHVGINAILFNRRHPNNQFKEYLGSELKKYANMPIFQFGHSFFIGPQFNFQRNSSMPLFITSIEGIVTVPLSSFKWSVSAGLFAKYINFKKDIVVQNDSVLESENLRFSGFSIGGEYRLKTPIYRKITIFANGRFGSSEYEPIRKLTNPLDSVRKISRGYDVSIGFRYYKETGWIKTEKDALNLHAFLSGEVGYFHPFGQLKSFYGSIQAGLGIQFGFGPKKKRVPKEMLKVMEWGPNPNQLQLVPQEIYRGPKF